MSDPDGDPGRFLPILERSSEGGEAHAAAEAEALLAEAGEREERPEPEPVDLDENEQELVELELDALGSVPEERRRAYDELGRTVEMGRIPVDLVPLLERLVAISLESGRARRRYLAEGERVLTGLFKRLPAGRELLSSIGGVNKALEVLDDRTVAGVEVGLRTLGHFRVVVKTEDVKVTLSVKSSSVALESLAVAGGG